MKPRGLNGLEEKGPSNHTTNIKKVPHFGGRFQAGFHNELSELPILSNLHFP